MNKIENISIVLYLTRSNSLRDWMKAGILDRELALYKGLVQRGCTVSIVSWAKSDESEYVDNTDGMQVLSNSLKLPTRAYEFLIPYLHASAFKSADIIKCNQASSASIALRGAKVHRKTMVMRFGYMWSDHIAKELGKNSAQTKAILDTEEKCLSMADHVICTTQEMSEDIAKRVPSTATKTTTIPNYVVPEIFVSQEDHPSQYDCLFVGRFADQKNLPALIEAVKKSRAKTLLVGDGPLEMELRQLAKGADISFMPRQPQEQLINLMRQSRMFVLPSFYEGHPKILLEAMFAGIPVVGTDAPGINNVIRQGETGLLCGLDTESLSNAIQYTLSHQEQAKTMAKAAQNYAQQRFSVETIVEKELQLYARLLANNKKAHESHG